MQMTLDGFVLTESMEKSRKSKDYYKHRSRYSIPAIIIVENVEGPLEPVGFF